MNQQQESVLFNNMSKTLSAAMVLRLREQSADRQLSIGVLESPADVKRREIAYALEQERFRAELKQFDVMKKANRHYREECRESKFSQDVSDYAIIASKCGERWLTDLLSNDHRTAPDFEKLFLSIGDGVMCLLVMANGGLAFAMKAEGRTAYRDRGYANCNGCWCHNDVLQALPGELPAEFLARCCASLQTVLTELEQNAADEEAWCKESRSRSEQARRHGRCVDHYNARVDRVEGLCAKLAGVIGGL